MPSKTGRRIARFLSDLGATLAQRGAGAAARGPAAAPARTPAERTLATLEDLERLSIARLKQAEQIFEFEVLAVEARASLDALRFFDVLLGVLLAAQIVAGGLLLGLVAPNAAAVFALLGVAVFLVCWGLAVTSWAEVGPVNSRFLTELASDPASARASAVISAAGVAKRNEARRVLKGRLFAFAVVLTVGDFAWAATAHAQALAAPPPVVASPSPVPTPPPTPAPTTRPTPRPTPRPTAHPIPHTPRPESRRSRAQRAKRTGSTLSGPSARRVKSPGQSTKSNSR